MVSLPASPASRLGQRPMMGVRECAPLSKAATFLQQWELVREEEEGSETFCKRPTPQRLALAPPFKSPKSPGCLLAVCRALPACTLSSTLDFSHTKALVSHRPPSIVSPAGGPFSFGIL